jgi:hypothetical protein
MSRQVIDCRKAIGAFSKENIVWILNFDRLFTNEKVFFRMSFFNAFYVLLAHLAPLWNAASGNGVLELRNLMMVSKALEPASRKRQKMFVRELVAFTEKFFKRSSVTNGWREVPQLWITERFNLN